MSTAADRILIIDDDPSIALLLYKALRESGYRVDTAKTGSSGLRKVADKKFDIIVLDLGLPDMSGLTVCRRLRADAVAIPIIVLTAESTVRSKVNLFDAGANDYIVKPFSLEELQARIRVCLRATVDAERLPPLQIGVLSLDRTTRTVQRDGLIISLRRKEFAILEYLMLHAGSAVTRASLMQYAWQGGDDGWTNTIDVHIKHLRDKVDRPFTDRLIRTVHGVGYKLELSDWVANTS